MTLRLHPDAEREIDEAFAYYERQRPGLGQGFIAAIERGLELIEQAPHAWPVVAGEARWHLTRKFPYGIVYVVRGSDTIVIAVAHLRRRRDYWLYRFRQLLRGS
jgi:plasmid stabilization system protein ParE